MLPGKTLAKLSALAVPLLSLVACAAPDADTSVSRSTSRIEAAAPAPHQEYLPPGQRCTQAQTRAPEDADGKKARTPCTSGQNGTKPAAGARLGIGDFSDAGASALAAASGLTELNPAYASFGPAAPVAMLGLKCAGKQLLTNAGLPAHEVNRSVESVGMLGGCYNLMLVAGAAAPPAAAVGAACGLVYNDLLKKRQRQANTRYLEFRDGEWRLASATADR
ncbi:hypothetical protein [Tropicimonas marinistellae]|uniref:hypothetical protein n=1 Tax=Tropicimonas marinistellae TaxID=1739787 RepID=UPI00083746DA|nr:hypothetical protein [Tropicimonas marinistellae]